MKLLTENIKFKIKELANLDKENEICGFVLIQNKELVVFECKNISTDKKESFKITPQQYLEAKEIGDIVAVYHSHINDFNEFSELDKKISESFNLKNILYLLKKDEFLEYTPCGYENPYIGRPYCLGVFDCYTLIQDYYKRELNIVISDINHPLRYIDDFDLYEIVTIEQIHNYIKEQSAKNNFIQIPIEGLKKHDVICIKADNTELPIHHLIYLGNGMVLHQPRGPSVMEKYNDKYRKKTVFVFRHKNLI